MFDSTAIEFHLIDDGFGISDNTIGIFTIKTVKSLSPGEFLELIAIEDDIFFSVNKWNLHDSEIDILKLPEKTIHYNQWYNARVAGKSCYYTHKVVDMGYMGILAGNEKILHTYEYKKIARKCYSKKSIKIISRENSPPPSASYTKLYESSHKKTLL